MTDKNSSKSSSNAAMPGTTGGQGNQRESTPENSQADDSQIIGPIEETQIIGPLQEKRIAESDRRSTDRRRSARGLFEIIARREQVDRRQLNRRGTGRFRLAFWRKSD